MRVVWLRERGASKAYEETFFRVPARTTMYVYRRSLSTDVVVNSEENLAPCVVLGGAGILGEQPEQEKQ